jgi:hypothetical protein
MGSSITLLRGFNTRGVIRTRLVKRDTLNAGSAFHFVSRGGVGANEQPMDADLKLRNTVLLLKTK